MPHPNAYNVSWLWKGHMVGYTQGFYVMQFIWIPIISSWEGHGSFIMMH